MIERGAIYDPLEMMVVRQSRQLRGMAGETRVEVLRKRLKGGVFYVIKDSSSPQAYLGRETDVRDDLDPSKIWVLRNGLHLVPVDRANIVGKVYEQILSGSDRNLINWILTEAKQTKPA